VEAFFGGLQACKMLLPYEQLPKIEALAKSYLGRSVMQKDDGRQQCHVSRTFLLSSLTLLFLLLSLITSVLRPEHSLF
jgi:hypothetical protein